MIRGTTTWFSALAVLVAAVCGWLLWDADRGASAAAMTWSSAAANTSQCLFLTAAALAGWSARQAARARSVSTLTRTAKRPAGLVTVQWYGFAAVVSLVVPATWIAFLGTRALGTLSALHLLVWAFSPVALLGWALFGRCLGSMLPSLIATPVAVLCGYVVPSTVEASGAFAWRHLLGMHGSCCAVDTTIHPTAAVVPLAVSAVTVITLFLVGHVAEVKGKLTAVAATTVGALVVASCSFAGHRAVASIENPDGVRPRPLSELVCFSGSPVICVWPEQRDQVPAIRDAATKVARYAASIGVAVPDELGVVDGSPWQFVYPLGPVTSSDDVLKSVAVGFVSPQMPDCALTQPWYYLEVLGDMAQWLYLHSGGEGRTGPASPALADVLRRDVKAQTAWFKANFAQRSACGVRPAR